MTPEFKKAMAFVFEREGGYATLANDEETNHGVRRSTWEEWLGHPVKNKEFKELTRDDVLPLYYSRYWIASGADRVPFKLGIALFDFAVNSGVGRAVKLLQEALGIKQDGVFGPLTKKAVDSEPIDSLLEDYIQARLDFLKTARNYSLYGKGWTNRVNLLKTFIQNA